MKRTWDENELKKMIMENTPCKLYRHIITIWYGDGELPDKLDKYVIITHKPTAYKLNENGLLDLISDPGIIKVSNRLNMEQDPASVSYFAPVIQEFTLTNRILSYNTSAYNSAKISIPDFPKGSTHVNCHIIKDEVSEVY